VSPKRVVDTTSGGPELSLVVGRHTLGGDHGGRFSRQESVSPRTLNGDRMSSSGPNPEVDPKGDEAGDLSPSATQDDRGVRETTADPVPTALWLRRSDQAIVWLLATSLLILLGIHWLRLSHWGRDPIEIRGQMPREYYYSVDINQASWVEWAQLDGIGEKLARRIVADREERGPFRDVADVSRVKGIGPKLLEKMKPFLRVGIGSEELTPKE
jgi:competence protein ComEA